MLSGVCSSNPAAVFGSQGDPDDTADAGKIAEFCALVLDRPVAEGATAQFAAIGVTDAETTGPRLMFHQVPEGKVVKNRLHLDIMTDDLDAETDRLADHAVGTQLRVASCNANGQNALSAAGL